MFTSAWAAVHPGASGIAARGVLGSGRQRNGNRIGEGRPDEEDDRAGQLPRGTRRHQHLPGGDGQLGRLGHEHGDDRAARRRRGARRPGHRRRRARSTPTRESIEQRCFTLLARQQPVAGDLRTITTAMRIVSDLERMGDLAEHIAKLARMRFPDHAVPQEVRPAFLEAGHVAEMLVAKTGQVIAKRDVEAARELETDDDAMDRHPPRAVPRAALRRLALRRRDGDRHHPARPLLRALRRPRRQRRPPRGLPGDRRAVHGRTGHRSCRDSSRLRYFLPWFLTASIAAAAASGSRYSPPVFRGRRSSSRS